MKLIGSLFGYTNATLSPGLIELSPVSGPPLLLFDVNVLLSIACAIFNDRLSSFPVEKQILHFPSRKIKNQLSDIA